MSSSCRRASPIIRRIVPRALPRIVLTIAILVALTACGPSQEPVATEPFDVVEATIAEIQSAITGGRTTCQAVVQAYLDRIEAYDQSTGLHAITVVNPKALERAAEIDAALAAGGSGQDLGPLFCAPILVKDNFDTHDLPTTGGSETLLEGYPPDDAFMVRKIREAGAIVLAKTNMAEWAFSPRQTVSSSYGTTANAYALDHTPAGSSGGTASGVAASFGVAGLGSDTGNSIRGPSSHLALFGIRSTIGLTSRDGVIPLAFDRDIAGPMTRTVEDGARLFNVLAGHDPADPLTEPASPERREENYLERLTRDGLVGARLGVLRVHADPEDTDPAILALFEAALADLQAAGAEIVDPFEVPHWDEHAEADSFCPTFRHDLAEYLLSRNPGMAPDDAYGYLQRIYDEGRYSPYVKEAMEFFLDYPPDLPPGQWDPPCPRYLEHPLRRAFLEDLTTAMDAARVDALVYPTWRYPPAPLATAVEDYRGDNSQLIAPATGMPAVTVPMGFVEGELPAGLQILGRRFDDGLLIQYAYAYEQATHHRKAPAGFPGLTREPAEGSPGQRAQ